MTWLPYLGIWASAALWTQYADINDQSSEKIEKDREIFVKNDDSWDHKLRYEPCPTHFSHSHSETSDVTFADKSAAHVLLTK